MISGKDGRIGAGNVICTCTGMYRAEFHKDSGYPDGDWLILGPVCGHMFTVPVWLQTGKAVKAVATIKQGRVSDEFFERHISKIELPKCPSTTSSVAPVEKSSSDVSASASQ